MSYHTYHGAPTLSADGAAELFTPRPWYELPTARRLLADLASDPPKRLFKIRRFVLTVDEWAEYDETDPRIIQLNAFASGAFEGAEAVEEKSVRAMGFTASVTTLIDEAIARLGAAS